MPKTEGATRWPSGPVDLAIVGGSAAGLMAAAAAGRTAQTLGCRLKIVVLDGARTLGAKILVSGGGRCNVTHRAVQESDYNGSTPAAIRRVLRAFGVPDTIAFFAEQGVPLTEEPTGKLFPADGQARSVLSALLGAARAAGAAILHPFRVEQVLPAGGSGFELHGAWGRLAARRVILATGGQSLPQSGSDGAGFGLARALGLALTPQILPALVPLTLPASSWLRSLSGLALPVRLTVKTPTGRRGAQVDGSLLFTHFGISGPAVLDISRHLLITRAEEPGADLSVAWLTETDFPTLDQALSRIAKQSIGRFLREQIPDRLAAGLLAEIGIDATLPGTQLPRPLRRSLALGLTDYRLTITGHRGFAQAEATAGGVPLAELKLGTLEARHHPGLHLAGELLDVDGRIGGFNFQWAWASGAVAGRAAARSLSCI